MFLLLFFSLHLFLQFCSIVPLSLNFSFFYIIFPALKKRILSILLLHLHFCHLNLPVTLHCRIHTFRLLSYGLLSLAIENFIKNLISNLLLLFLLIDCNSFFLLLKFELALILLLPRLFVVFDFLIVITDLKHSRILQHILWGRTDATLPLIILSVLKFLGYLIILLVLNLGR